jgi:hypothetical protein
MKRRRRLLRYVRTLAIAGACLAVFASSAVAGGGRTKPVLSRHAPGPVVYRAGDAASSRVPGSAIQPVSEPFVTRTVVDDDGGQTPAIILAGSALAIALSGAALVVVRLNRNPVGLH